MRGSKSEIGNLACTETIGSGNSKLADRAAAGFATSSDASIDQSGLIGPGSCGTVTEDLDGVPRSCPGTDCYCVGAYEP